MVINNIYECCYRNCDMENQGIFLNSIFAFQVSDNVFFLQPVFR
jgi:hypothetical protein